MSYLTFFSQKEQLALQLQAELREAKRRSLYDEDDAPLGNGTASGSQNLRRQLKTLKKQGGDLSFWLADINAR